VRLGAGFGGGLDEYLVAGSGDARHGLARITSPPLGHRLHLALPDGGLVDLLRV
jgi:hypothetical protein